MCQNQSPVSIQPAGGSGESGETLPVGHAFAGHGGRRRCAHGTIMKNLRDSHG